MPDSYGPQADSVGSYDDAIRALRCDFLKGQIDIAVKALLDIKRFTDGGAGRKAQLAFTTARDALIELDRNPTPVKRG